MARDPAARGAHVTITGRRQELLDEGSESINGQRIEIAGCQL